MPGSGFLPWQDWGQTPWANAPEGRSQEAQAWFNVMLPWMQAANQAGQWGQEFDWRKAADQWTQGFQEQQFAHQQTADVWAQGFQEQQLREQSEQAAMQTFGRRWKPSTRWM